MKVLIADDDGQVRDYLALILETGLDCEIMEASSGNEAISIFEFDTDINLVITEVKMKGGDGHVIVDYLEEEGIEIPIVWLSSAQNNDVMIVQEVLARNSLNSFVAKPFKDDEFFPYIEKILESQSSSKKSSSKESAREEDQLEKPKSQLGRTEEEDFYKREKKAAKSEEAGYSLARESKEHSGESADYSLEFESKNHKEESADYSIGMKSQNHGEEEADYSLGVNKLNNGEEEADYSLGLKSKNHGEEEADYSLGSESKNHGEEEADYSLGSESKNHGEEEADYSVGLKSKDHEQEDADYSLGSESKNHGEEDADYSIGLNSKEHEEEDADYSIKKYYEGVNSNGDAVTFRQIKIKRFLNFNQVCCDGYLKLSETKFVKFIAKNQEFDKSTLEKYQDKGVEQVYIENESYEVFCNQFSDLVSNRLKQSLNFNEEIQAVAQLAAFQSTRDMAREFGVSQVAADKVKESVEANLKSLSKNTDLSTLLNRILRGGDYISERSLLVSYFAGQICMKTSWSSTAALEKLSMAALMHDMALDENRLAKCRTSDDLNKLSEESAKKVKEHPGEAAKIISEGKSVFSDVEAIIIQHHERPDGTGFPRGLGALSISPLSCIFIIASEFAYEVYGKPSNKVDIEAIKEKFKNTYSKGNFKKPLAAFLLAF